MIYYLESLNKPLSLPVSLPVPNTSKVGAPSELMFTNPHTLIVFAVKLIDSSVTLSFCISYSQFIQITNLQNSKQSKAWWWVLLSNIHGKRKILDDKVVY